MAVTDRVCKVCKKEFRGSQNTCAACRQKASRENKEKNKTPKEIRDGVNEKLGPEAVKIASDAFKGKVPVPVWRVMTMTPERPSGGMWVLPGHCKEGVCLNPGCPNEGTKAIEVGPPKGVPQGELVISIKDPTPADIAWAKKNAHMGSAWANWGPLVTNACIRAAHGEHEFKTHLRLLQSCEG